MTEATQALRAHLNANGGLQGSEGLALLEAAWPDLDGCDLFGMDNSKLRRIEKASWAEPIFTFVIERHGGTVLGSSRAERQQWALDLEAQTADATTLGYRQLTPRRPGLDADKLADEIVEKMEASLDDQLLEWSPDRKTVCILVSAAINPEGGRLARLTAEGRRERLRAALVTRLPNRGWQEITPARWDKENELTMQR